MLSERIWSVVLRFHTSFQPVNLPQWGWEPSWKADSGIADDAPNIIAARQNKWDLSGLEKPRMDDATYYEHGMGLDGIINTASDYVVSISSDSPETYITSSNSHSICGGQITAQRTPYQNSSD